MAVVIMERIYSIPDRNNQLIIVNNWLTQLVSSHGKFGSRTFPDARIILPNQPCTKLAVFHDS